MRPIENFSWYPQLQQDVHIDASQSRIRELSIHLQAGHQGHIHLKLPQQGMHLHLQGNLEQITVTAGLPESLSLSPATSKNPADKAFQLPDMGCLKQVGTLELRNGAGKQAVSLQNLLQFSKLDSLSLWGNHSDLAQLSSCTQLRALSLRFMRHLSELPALQAWPQLDSFIAYNVEEAAGKRLRQQLKERTRARPWAGYTSVSQLRKPEWWNKEYGRPFAGWPAARARIAYAAYDLAEQEIGTASSLDHVQAALTTFTARFNTVKGIETSEREDLGLAVQQLAQLPAALALKLTHEQAGQWFDENRDY
ncbi:transcriptional regulator [Comamonas sp. C24C]